MGVEKKIGTFNTNNFAQVADIKPVIKQLATSFSISFTASPGTVMVFKKHDYSSSDINSKIASAIPEF